MPWQGDGPRKWPAKQSSPASFPSRFDHGGEAVGPSSHGAEKRKWSLADTEEKPHSRAVHGLGEATQREPFASEVDQWQVNAELHRCSYSNSTRLLRLIPGESTRRPS